MAFNSLSSMKTVLPWEANQKWYMLQRNADRLDSRGQAKAGSLFQIDYNETKLRSSERYGSVIILENIECERQKVFWQPELFVSLDDDLKALLVAVDDPKERLHIYTDTDTQSQDTEDTQSQDPDEDGSDIEEDPQPTLPGSEAGPSGVRPQQKKRAAESERKDLLYYAKSLKVGMLTGLTLPGSGRETFGEVKYIGPSKAGDATKCFGIELSEPLRDPSVPKMESELFKCIQNRGVIVPVNCLKAHTKTIKPTLLEMGGKHPLKSSQTKDDSGLSEEAAKLPTIREDDVVMVFTKMCSGHGKCSWVMGKVLLIHDGKVAVEVDISYGSLLQSWNGFYKGTKLLTIPSRQTVLVELQYIQTLDQHIEKVSSPVTRQKESGSEHFPVTHSGRNHEEQKKRKPTKQGKSILSAVAASLPFRGVGFTSFSPEEETNTKENAWEEERQKKLLREVEDLGSQLGKMKTTHADTVKRLEESQKVMLTFKSKSAELAAELYHTKLNLASQQEEVERLLKELEDSKNQICLGNEPLKKIRKLLMEEHGLTRVAVNTVFTLSEEYDLRDCIEAVKAVRDNLQQVQECFQECTTCFTHFGMHKLVALPTCECLICTECFTQYFTVLAKTTTCMYKFSCPACNNPNLEDSDQENYQFYFSLLGTLLMTYLEKDDYELYEVKLATWGLMEDPNFRWCAHGCSAGFINERRQKKIQCPECKKYQCFHCKKPWLDQHKNISCEEFDAWKKANDPEFQQQGLAAHLKENGINCPKCKMRYELAKGGCMHFKCPRCHHQFCCGCNLPFRTNPACNLLPSCKGKGLHAHHPRDCFYYLRDENCDDLQLLLQKHKVGYNATSNAAGNNGGRAQVCPVKEQQETPDGLVDAVCGKPLKGQCGLCENHYKEYLVGLINQHNIDPVEVFGVQSLEATLRRNDRKIPVRAGNEANADYCARLRQEVQQQLPLRPRNAQGVSGATYQI